MLPPTTVILVPPDLGPIAGIAGGQLREGVCGAKIVNSLSLSLSLELSLTHECMAMKTYHELKIIFRLYSFTLAMSECNEDFVRHNTTLLLISDTGESAVEIKDRVNFPFLSLPLPPPHSNLRYSWSISSDITIHAIDHYIDNVLSSCTEVSSIDSYHGTTAGRASSWLKLKVKLIATWHKTEVV